MAQKPSKMARNRPEMIQKPQKWVKNGQKPSKNDSKLSWYIVYLFLGFSLKLSSITYSKGTQLHSILQKWPEVAQNPSNGLKLVKNPDKRPEMAQKPSKKGQNWSKILKKGPK